MSTFSKNLVNEWTPELILKRIFRNTDTCDDMYSMPRENKFGIAKEETDTVGKKRRTTVLRMRSECSSQVRPLRARRGSASSAGMPSCTTLCIRRVKGCADLLSLWASLTWLLACQRLDVDHRAT